MKILEKKWIMISFIMATKSKIENYLAEENNLYSRNYKILIGEI